MSNALKRDTMELLIKHEGMRHYAYKDTEGHLTIGVGRNLDAIGISEEEALLMLSSDYDRCVVAASKYSWYSKLDNKRKQVIISMIFNLGASAFRDFKRMIGALEKLDFDKASQEMLSSSWSAQVKKRAVELSRMMKEGDVKPPET